MTREELKRELGEQYIFRKHMSEKEVRKFRKSKSEAFELKTVASLTAGYVKIEAALFRRNGKVGMGYDVFVRDGIGENDWICYDSYDKSIRVNERGMLDELYKAVKKNGLSCTECKFEYEENSKEKHSEER